MEVLLDAAKLADAGQDFEDNKHSDDARRTAMQYLIGVTEPNPPAFPMQSKGKLVPTPAKPVTPQNVVEENDNTLLYAGAVAAIVAAGYFLFRKSTA